jgi:exosome complex component RRP46
MGHTNVVAAVYGPAQPRYSRHEKVDKATIVVQYIVQDSKQQSSCRENEAFVASVLESVVRTSEFPRMLISVVVEEFFADGSVLAAAVNAAAMAFVDAGIPMNAVPCAVSCITSLNGVALLDPCKEEEESATTVCTLAFRGQEEGIVACNAFGPFTTEEFFACTNVCVAAGKTLHTFLCKAIEHKVRRDMHTFG